MDPKDVRESVPLLEIEDLFSAEGAGAWIHGCQGVTVGSVSCPATVASSFSFT
ncbi:hypothetical protein DFJ68_3321 [Terracoccus luteus]|jgi:hypothetical protein|uniref:Uncharacterized protein n=1 Tax=Terracoccus luteus TaxID=53356 RepID=A0A495Y3S5_9MICO|nr:hypothetical protein [Terracoccus luteus]RKT79843.1 hypothetical protein DFJ68_3321 [Terracoccus luteus]